MMQLPRAGLSSPDPRRPGFPAAAVYEGATTPSQSPLFTTAMRLGPTTGAFAFVPEEASMFEEQPQPEIDALIKANPEFKQLYQHHKKLDKKVMDAELGVLPIDDVTLAQMKREKLAAKDRLVQMYDKRPD